MRTPPFANLFHKHFRRKESERQASFFLRVTFTASLIECQRDNTSSARRHLARAGVISSWSRLLAGCLGNHPSLHRLILLIEPHSPGGQGEFLDARTPAQECLRSH